MEKALKYTKMTKSKKTSKRVNYLTSDWNKKITRLPICF